MKKYCLILLLGFSLILSAQRIETKNIFHISDSILISHIGQNIKKYFEVSQGSYYKYPSKTGKFLDKKYLKKGTEEIYVLYSFKYKEIEGVNGGVWVVLDKNLNLKWIGDLNFIPDFLRTNNQPNFISINTAKEIAVKNFKKEGLRVEDAKLDYNSKLKKYTFTVSNIITSVKNQIGKESGEMEVVEVDAVTSEFLSNQKAYFGVIIR